MLKGISILRSFPCFKACTSLCWYCTYFTVGHLLLLLYALPFPPSFILYLSLPPHFSSSFLLFFPLTSDFFPTALFVLLLDLPVPFLLPSTPQSPFFFLFVTFVIFFTLKVSFYPCFCFLCFV